MRAAKQRADRARSDQDLLVEVDVLGIDLVEEVDGFGLLRRAFQHIPAGAAEVGRMRGTLDIQLRNRCHAPFAGLIGLRLDRAGDPDARRRPSATSPDVKAPTHSVQPAVGL